MENGGVQEQGTQNFLSLVYNLWETDEKLAWPNITTVQKSN